MEVHLAGLALDIRPTVVAGAGGGEGAPQVALDVRFARSWPPESELRQSPWDSIETPRVVVDSVRAPAGSSMLVFSARGDEQGRNPADLPRDATILVRPSLLRAE